MIVSSEMFNLILKDTWESSESVLGKKAKIYANDDDRFHNFRKAETIINLVKNKDTPAYAA